MKRFLNSVIQRHVNEVCQAVHANHFMNVPALKKTLNSIRTYRYFLGINKAELVGTLHKRMITSPQYNTYVVLTAEPDNKL